MMSNGEPVKCGQITRRTIPGANRSKELKMLQKQSFSIDYALYAVIAVGAIAVFVIIASLVSGAQIESLSSQISDPSVSGNALDLRSSAEMAEAARWNGLTSEFVNVYGSTTVLRAPGNLRTHEATSQRLRALAANQLNLYGSTVWVRGIPMKAHETEVARLQGMASRFVNLFGSTARAGFEPSQATMTEAARLQALAGGH